MKSSYVSFLSCWRKTPSILFMLCEEKYSPYVTTDED
jgi:hypothetical protein